MKQANVSLSDISAVAVTYGAGLLGALLVGVSYAKALAYAMNVPLIKVNHVRGHISANYIADKSLEPPYLCLLASGGHTAIKHSTKSRAFWGCLIPAARKSKNLQKTGNPR
ncbi:MAG: hypothetical protein BHV97_03570 [Clostridium sp. CAG:349_48_7]|nr:MAG: hypothetical protein BHV97_03570 [Clostridium sp. CAG:349_48_7]